MTGRYDIIPLTRWVSAKSKLTHKERVEVRRCLLDTLACLGGGWPTPVSQRAGEALGSRRLGMISVALRFGTAMHALEFDDLEIQGSTHPSSAILAALLPLADQLDATIEQLSVAYVCGFETIVWFGRTLGSNRFDVQWQTAATTGLFGVVAACARLLELNSQQVGNGLSIASGYGNQKRQFENEERPLSIGMTAAEALMIVPLIKAGHASAKEAWNGREGFMARHHASQPSSEFANDQLGIVSAFESLGVVRKPYPSCHFTHRLIEAALNMRTSIDPSKVEKILLEMPAEYASAVSNSEPLTPYAARYSVRFCVASSLLDGVLDNSSFRPDRIHRAEIDALMKAITLCPYEVQDLEEFSPNSPDRITITTANGDDFSNEVLCVPGSIAQPLTDSTLSAKTAQCLGPVLSEDDIQRLISLTIEEGVKVRELTALIKKFRPVGLVA